PNSPEIEVFSSWVETRRGLEGLLVAGRHLKALEGELPVRFRATQELDQFLAELFRTSAPRAIGFSGLPAAQAQPVHQHAPPDAGSGQRFAAQHDRRRPFPREFLGTSRASVDLQERRHLLRTFARPGGPAWR